ncbi:MAG TPA: hypothetical protein VK157_05605 [Phycisphaerales bacterium]|nr:hypothetical protein [Phycisphaerales bacterium]
MQTAVQRIDELLARHTGDAAWAKRSVEIAARMPYCSLIEQHPHLRRLRELDEGWLDKAKGVRVDSIYPELEDVAFAESIELELAKPDATPSAGPYADFDPRNAVFFANIPFMSVWFSLIALPDEPVIRWPVVQCDPSTDDTGVKFVAVNVLHFIHQWMCREGPDMSSPIEDVDEPAAGAIVSVMHAVFSINKREALALREFDRARGDRTFPPVPPALRAYVDDATLDRLRPLIVPQIIES